jgi:DNA polymerase III subunit delta'
MFLREVIGQDEIKKNLISSVQQNKVSHAQLFLGKDGYGTLPLALAFAQYLACTNRSDSDSCGKCSNCIKSQKLIHPDIHYSYPVVTKKSGEKPLSTDFIEDWRKIVLDDPYFTPDDWIEKIDAENKQGNISVHECADIISKLKLKSFESEYKIQIIWKAEYLREAGNVLLKLLEEPPANTVFILIAEQLDLILKTIQSRTQLTKIPRITDSVLIHNMDDVDLPADKKQLLLNYAEGDIIALNYLVNESINSNEPLLEQWVVLVKNHPSIDDISWVEDMARIGREKQKSFCMYALHTLRDALVLNFIESSAANDKLAVEITEEFDTEQIEQLVQLFNDTFFYIERNANAKITFMNLVIRAGRILQRKSVVL